MKNLKYTFVILAIMFFGSCEGTFTTVLNVDPPDHEELLVVHFFVNNLENKFGALITETYPVLEEKSLEETKVDNAEISLLRNGQNFKKLINEDFDDFNYTLDLDEFLEDDDVYTIKVEHPRYGTLTADQIMPAEVQNIEVALIENGGRNFDDEEISFVDVTFDDVNDVENYYELTIGILDRNVGDFYSVYAETVDPNAQESYNYNAYLVSDQGFDGKRYKIRFEVNRYNYQQLRDNGIISFSSITKDLFEYSASRRIQDQSQDFGGFAEPGVVRTNIKGGLGCFGFSRIQLVTF